MSKDQSDSLDAEPDQPTDIFNNTQLNAIAE